MAAEGSERVMEGSVVAAEVKIMLAFEGKVV